MKKDIKKKYESEKAWALTLLRSGAALSKMREIIKAQGGDPKISSKKMTGGKNRLIIKAERNGKIDQVSSKNITLLAKLLGAPEDRMAGLVLYKRLDEVCEKGEELCVFHSESEYRLREAADSYDLFPIYEIRR